jgi:hypothetical protein
VYSRKLFRFTYIFIEKLFGIPDTRNDESVSQKTIMASEHISETLQDR